MEADVCDASVWEGKQESQKFKVDLGYKDIPSQPRIHEVLFLTDTQTNATNANKMRDSCLWSPNNCLLRARRSMVLSLLCLTNLLIEAVLIGRNWSWSHFVEWKTQVLELTKGHTISKARLWVQKFTLHCSARSLWRVGSEWWSGWIDPWVWGTLYHITISKTEPPTLLLPLPQSLTSYHTLNRPWYLNGASFCLLISTGQAAWCVSQSLRSELGLCHLDFHSTWQSMWQMEGTQLGCGCWTKRWCQESFWKWDAVCNMEYQLHKVAMNTGFPGMRELRNSWDLLLHGGQMKCQVRVLSHPLHPLPAPSIAFFCPWRSSDALWRCHEGWWC